MFTISGFIDNHRSTARVLKREIIPTIVVVFVSGLYSARTGASETNMCKRIVVPLLLSFLLCVGARAQGDANQYRVDCAKFGPGCSLYNRLLEQNNEALIRAVKSHAFVCFRTAENVFIVVHHREPDEARFVQAKTPGVSL